MSERRPPYAPRAEAVIVVSLASLPPSVNGLYRRDERGRLVKRAAAQHWVEELGWAILEALTKAPRRPEPPYRMDVHLVVPSSVRLDIDNGLKATLDAVAGALQFDDADVMELHVTKECASPARCDVRLSEAGGS